CAPMWYCWAKLASAANCAQCPTPLPASKRRPPSVSSPRCCPSVCAGTKNCPPGSWCRKHAHCARRWNQLLQSRKLPLDCYQSKANDHNTAPDPCHLLMCTTHHRYLFHWHFCYHGGN